MMIVIHTTKDQIETLLPIFGKLTYNEAGEQDLETPAWLDFMSEHSTGEDF
jgi:hypothetical protein